MSADVERNIDGAAPHSAPLSEPVSETTSLLPKPATKEQRSWFRQATPAKLVFLVILASLSRGLTLSPRIDVYTHLACSAIRHEHTVFTPYSLPQSISRSYSPSSLFERNPLPHTGPSKYCLSDPVVQSAAASLQTVLNTSIGVLSAITSGYWGSFGDRFGRKWVAWLVVLGLMSQDLVFIFCAAYGTQLHLGRYTLILGSILEGLFGSWAAFNGVTNSYISDCSRPGSKAKTFALFQGLFYLGISLGPALGSTVLRYTGLPTMGLFYIAIAANVLNLLHIPMFIPESLPKAARSVNTVRPSSGAAGPITPVQPPLWRRCTAGVFNFMRPLRILTPRRNLLGDSDVHTSVWDVDLTLLGVASFCSFLLSGIAPNKYLYAEHVFGWDAARLGYYITIIASCRALWLIVALPVLIKSFKPKSKPQPIGGASLSAAQRRALLLPAMRFDLRVARLSLFVDATASLLTCFASTSLWFTVFSTMGSFGGGALPASQSMMVALMSDGAGASESEVGIGGMFGAISMLQAIGQNIMGPLLFGAIYANTVARFPQAIFASGASLLLTAFISLLFVAPHRKVSSHLWKHTAPSNALATPNRRPPRRKRGRSRTAKDLRRPSFSSQFDSASSSPQSSTFDYNSLE